MYAMRKSFILLLAAFLAAVSALAQGKAKYVFYFIGDGMGVNQVGLTETYLADLEGRIGTSPLCFASFPHSAFVTTYSATNGVTDSAAAGTALSTGKKTRNGVLGMHADQQTSVSSIAVQAHEAGFAVGITTSVSIDHATPAAFYAHVPSRNDYYRIGQQLAASGYEFFGGAAFVKPENKKNPQEGTLYEQCRKAGYTIAHTSAEAKSKMKLRRKMMLLQREEANPADAHSLPYAIDRDDDALTLPQITETAIEFLEKQSKKGFFLMVEGGKIDYACHDNDAGTAIREVLDLDSAVRVALRFYREHPDETLIVVTADHETGGIALGRGPYELHSAVFRHQRMSVQEYTRHLAELRKEDPEKFTWERVAKDLRENWGLDGEVKISDSQRKRLRTAYDRLVEGSDKGSDNLYSHLDGLSGTARAILAEHALVGWQSGGHSNGYVPVFAIGCGAEQFHGRIDNTLIPQIITRTGGW